MSHSGAEGQRRLTIWGWLLLALLMCVGVIPSCTPACTPDWRGCPTRAEIASEPAAPSGLGTRWCGPRGLNVAEGFLTLGGGRPRRRRGRRSGRRCGTAACVPLLDRPLDAASRRIERTAPRAADRMAEPIYGSPSQEA